MKILVLGASGMAGHVISLFFSEKGYDVSSLSRRPLLFLPNNIIGDVLDFPFLSKLIEVNDYDVIINCVGILNQDAEENRSRAVLINSYLPHFLVDLLKGKKGKLIHMSTDCVFAGNTGPYFENSVRDGHSFYDRSKALGEIDYDSKHLTFRNSIVGPDINNNGIGLFNWFMKQKGPIKGFSKAIWTGVTTCTLAKAMDHAISSDISGLYNLVNNDSISKFELLKLFNANFRNNDVEILPDNNLILDKSLLNSRNDFDFQVPSYLKMVQDMKEWVDNHKELYQY
ncbi:SDR family oxidoreductase [Sphingobacterium kyonggiense]|uniref:dTDP-4-dehydrorhamnose reductase n=1 Tax=Sphingobacterium kyonggiense TaxID=714075 RepID=A0ABP7Z3W8_9SPHI